MSWLDRLFLVKTIVSREGCLHFRRWRLFETPWFAIYVHNIARSDEEKHPHSHPWSFVSVILKGDYREDVWMPDGWYQFERKAGWVAFRRAEHFHKIRLREEKPVWSLVFVGPRREKPWGYLTESGVLDHVTYRRLKNS